MEEALQLLQTTLAEAEEDGGATDPTPEANAAMVSAHTRVALRDRGRKVAADFGSIGQLQGWKAWRRCMPACAAAPPQRPSLATPAALHHKAWTPCAPHPAPRRAQNLALDGLRLSAQLAYEVLGATREGAPAALAEAAQLLHTHALLVGGSGWACSGRCADVRMGCQDV